MVHLLKRISALKYLRNEDGSTATVLAISMPIIIGACVMMTEAGYWRLEKSRLQDTADMAALAGGYQYIIANDKDETKVAVYADARDNRFSPDVGVLTTNIPPLSGNYVGQDAVEVTIRQKIPTFVSHIFMDKDVYATVTSVVVLGGQNSPACVLSLAGGGTGISVGGTVDVGLVGCGLHSNSNSSTAVNAFGNVHVEAACVSATGGVAFSGSASYDLEECPSPRSNQPEINDPYADLDVPSGVDSMACSAVTYSGNGNNTSVSFPDPAGGVTRLCGGTISLSGTTTLQPGTYVFDGTDISFGSHAELHGTDVTLIFMNDGEITSINGNNTIDLEAPKTGDYAGIVMYGDRDTMSSDTWDFNGNADISLTGVIYLPTLDVDYGGGAGTNATQCTQLVAARVNFIGNSGFNSNCEGWGTRDIVGGAYTSVQLVE